MSLAPYQQRVVDEYEELIAKTERLSAFLAAPPVALDSQQGHLMHAQLHAMQAYGYILSCRIGAF